MSSTVDVSRVSAIGHEYPVEVVDLGTGPGRRASFAYRRPDLPEKAVILTEQDRSLDAAYHVEIARSSWEGEYEYVGTIPRILVGAAIASILYTEGR